MWTIQKCDEKNVGMFKMETLESIWIDNLCILGAKSELRCIQLAKRFKQKLNKLKTLLGFLMD